MSQQQQHDYRQIAAYLLDQVIPASRRPVIGIICGSGLSGLSATMTDTISVPFKSIPGFPLPTVAGHSAELVFGVLAGVHAVCLRGRFHSYEGYSIQTVVPLPVRVMRCIGVKMVIVTNAAGGLNPDYNVGDVVCVMDHLALPMLSGFNPLIGKNDDELGPRFPPTSNCYDEKLQEKVLESASSLGMDFVRKDGQYCFVSGPQYESKAECRFLRSCGGDCVGMSTIPEVVAAHHCGMKVLCLSLVTNKVITKGDEGPAASHQEVLDAVNQRSEQLQEIVKEFVKTSKSYLESLPELKAITLPKYKKPFSRCKTCGLPHLYVKIGITVAVTAAFAMRLRMAK